MNTFSSPHGAAGAESLFAELRLQGWSYARIARRLGVSIDTVSRICRSQIRPSESMLERVRHLLGPSVEPERVECELDSWLAAGGPEAWAGLFRQSGAL